MKSNSVILRICESFEHLAGKLVSLSFPMPKPIFDLGNEVDELKPSIS